MHTRRLPASLYMESLASLRLNKQVPHSISRADGSGRIRCILCCSLCTFGNGKLRPRNSTHARYGHLQAFKCSTCHNAALCRKKCFVWMGKHETCFQLFHSVPTEELQELVQCLCSTANPVDGGYSNMIDSERLTFTVQKSESFKNMWKNKKSCGFEHCSAPPTFNYEDCNAPRFCAKHKLEGMVDMKSTSDNVKPKRKYNRRECGFEGCSKYASFNFDGRNAVLCSQHKVDGMVRCRAEKKKSEPKERGPYKKAKVGNINLAQALSREQQRLNTSAPNEAMRRKRYVPASITTGKKVKVSSGLRKSTIQERKCTGQEL